MCVNPDLQAFMNRVVLSNTYLLVRDARGGRARGRDVTNDSLRWCAYRHFTAWAHGHLGKFNRRVAPSCVVKRLRELYPSPQYAGYRAAIGY